VSHILPVKVLFPSFAENILKKVFEICGDSVFYGEHGISGSDIMRTYQNLPSPR